MKIDFLNKQIKNCNLCSLSKIRNNSILLPNQRVDILFISLFLEDFEAENFIKTTAKTAYSSLLKCQPKQKALEFFLKNSSLNESIECCKNYILEYIKTSSPKIIITLGKEVFFALVGEKNEAFSVLKGGVYRFENSLLIPSYSLDFLAKNPSLYNEIKVDLSKIRELI